MTATFQTKSFAAIAASMINHARATQGKVTDFVVGSKIRTLLESPAVEIEQLYNQALNGLLEAIPVSIYSSFGFPREAAQNSTGLIALEMEAQTADTTIGANTIWPVSGSSAKYVNPADITVPNGTTSLQVRVVSTVAGASSNLAGGTAFTMLPQVAGFISATAAADFVDGQDEETNDQLKKRFTSFVKSLPRGTPDSIEYVLANLARLYDANGLEIERVESSYVDEQWERDHSLPRALVDVYIFNGVDGASTDLQAYTLKLITGYVDDTGTKVAGYKSAGVHFDVYAATLDEQPVVGALILEEGYDYDTAEAAAEVAVRNYLLGLAIGATAFPQQISKAAETVDGVVSFTCTTPGVPVTPALGAKIVAGTFTVTQDTTPYQF